MRFCLIVAGAFASIAAVAAASPALAANGVHVRADGRIGGGYSVRRDADCFAVTARHVVIDEDNLPADAITVTDAAGVSAKADVAVEYKDLDLALLKLKAPASFACNTDWQDGGGVDSALDSSETAVVEILSDNQSSERKRLFYAGKQGTTKLSFRPETASDRIIKGNSGSPFYVGDHLVGIVTEIEPDTGRASVLRQDVIHATLKQRVLINSGALVIVRPFQNHQAGRQATHAAMAEIERIGGFKHQEPDAAPDQYGRMSEKIPVDADYILEGSIISVSQDRAEGAMSASPVKSVEEGVKKGVKSPVDIFGGVIGSGDADGGDGGDGLGKASQIFGEVLGNAGGGENSDEASAALGGMIDLFGGMARKDKKGANGAERASTPAPASRQAARPEFHLVFTVEAELKLTNIHTGTKTTHFIRDKNHRAPYGADAREEQVIAVEKSIGNGVSALFRKAGVGG